MAVNLPKRKFCFRSSWNFIPTISWPRCILIGLCVTKKRRRTKPGMRWKYLKEVIPRHRIKTAARHELHELSRMGELVSASSCEAAAKKIIRGVCETFPVAKAFASA